MLFENFYAQEWVQVCTAFAYVALIIIIPFIYWRFSQRLSGVIKAKFIEVALDIYGLMFFLLIAPAGYLVLYFLGSESKFMLNDPMAWVCLVGAASSIYDLLRARFSLNSAKDQASCKERLNIIFTWRKLTVIALFLSLIPLFYGIVMVAVTNLMDTASIHSMLWFLTFLMTGVSVIYAVVSKSVLLVSQAYASDPTLGCSAS